MLYDFLTLYTKLPHSELKSKLSSIGDFASKGGGKLILDCFIMVQHTGGENKRGLGFNKTSLKTAINHWIENFYFNDGNMTMKQAFDIPMQINPVLFWAIPMRKINVITNFFW